MESLQHFPKFIFTLVRLAVVISLSWNDLYAGPIKSKSHVQRRSEDEHPVMPVDYLTTFGYLKKPKQNYSGPLVSQEDYISAISDLQEMTGIPVTGKLDSMTINMMKRPRCGSPPENFAIGVSKWEKMDITYRILNYSPDLSESDTRSTLRQAFQLWESHSSLIFREVAGSADIEIKFVFGRHAEDPYDFDGKGKVLAHAFPPGDGRGGDVHFDDEETWTVNSPTNTNLLMAAAHEFGHSIGIKHSKEKMAIMYEFYQDYDPNLALRSDDIEALQYIYGGSDKRSSTTTTTTTKKPSIKTLPPPQPDSPDPCRTNFDAVSKIRGEMFAFKGKWFWRLDENGLLPGFPIEISSFWWGFPKTLDGIDAVYERTQKNNTIVFFKGNRFWEFKDNQIANGFPLEGRPLSDLKLANDIQKIDASLVLNGRTYLLSGSNYWLMNNVDGLTTEPGYPKPLATLWHDLPFNLDSAFTHMDGTTYFVKGIRYWTLDNSKETAFSDYSMTIGNRWLNCPGSYTENNSVLFLISKMSAISIASLVVVYLSEV